MSGLRSGEEKNSLPFMNKEIIEEVHSIVIAPFFGDKDNWQGAAYNIVVSSPRVSPVKAERIERSEKRELSSALPENRAEILGRIGRSMHADAVLNGVILDRGGKKELILQLVYSGDSRILWWQAVDIHFREGSLTLAAQKELLSKMLEPLLLSAGKKVKSQPRTESQPKTDTKPKTDKPDIDTKEDISPM